MATQGFSVLELRGNVSQTFAIKILAVAELCTSLNSHLAYTPNYCAQNGIEVQSRGKNKMALVLNCKPSWQDENGDVLHGQTLVGSIKEYIKKLLLQLNWNNTPEVLMSPSFYCNFAGTCNFH